MPMTLIVLSIFILTALAFSVLDSSLRRGPRLTFNFFFFAFLYILGWIWKDICPVLFSLTPAGRPDRPDGGLSLAQGRCDVVFTWLVSVITIAGWMLLFYFGWFAAEKILQRFSVLKKRLFLTLLLSPMVISAALLPVIKIINMPNRHKLEVPAAFNDILLIGHPGYSFAEGFFFSLYFLGAYFLIECSGWRRKNWKMIFFFLPFIHLWVMRLSGGGDAVFFERVVVFTAVAVLAFFNRSRLIDERQRGTAR